MQTLFADDRAVALRVFAKAKQQLWVVEHNREIEVEHNRKTEACHFIVHFIETWFLANHPIANQRWIESTYPVGPENTHPGVLRIGSLNECQVKHAIALGASWRRETREWVVLKKDSYSRDRLRHHS